LFGFEGFSSARVQATPIAPIAIASVASSIPSRFTMRRIFQILRWKSIERSGYARALPMRYEFTESQLAWRDEVRAFIRAHSTPELREEMRLLSNEEIGPEARKFQEK